jgi:hypothetical protein
MYCGENGYTRGAPRIGLGGNSIAPLSMRDIESTVFTVLAMEKRELLRLAVRKREVRLFAFNSDDSHIVGIHACWIAVLRQ